MLGSAHDSGGIDRDDALARQRLEQHAHGGEALLDRRGRQTIARHGFDPRRYMQRRDGVETAATLAAIGEDEEIMGGAKIGAPRVGVADLGGEELQDRVPGGGTGGGDGGRP